MDRLFWNYLYMISYCLSTGFSAQIGRTISNDLYMNPCKAAAFEGDISLTTEDLGYLQRKDYERKAIQDSDILDDSLNSRQCLNGDTKCRKQKRRETIFRRNTDHVKRRITRAATSDPNRLWNYGVIPYEIENIFTEHQKAIFMSAMRHWENHTCITFIERQPSDPDYIVFTQKTCGCCSFVGKELSGPQAISIGKNCDKFGIVVHELGHVIGFWHEHTRPDRDQYIDILTQNIQTKQEKNFEKMTTNEINSLGEKYDYGSIMHYARNTFSRASYLDTINPKVPADIRPKIGQRLKLSPGDIRQANKLYKCPVCGKTRQESSGRITHIPVLKQNQTCQWRISATRGELVKLTISSLDIPNTKPSNCNDSYLEVRDGYYFKSKLIGKYCGQSPPPLIQSTGNRLWMEYKTSDGLGTGFVASYKTVCGGEITDEKGHLTSPNYPDDYQANKDCIWIFTVKDGFTVGIKFDFLEIENHDSCVYDHIEIRDGESKDSPLIGKYCGYQIPGDVRSSSNKLYLRFFSDATVQKQGFSLSYISEQDECKTKTHGCDQICKNTLGSYVCECNIGFELRSDGKTCEDACGGYLSAETGIIKSPSFPNLYPAGKNCVWQIKAPDQYRITLTFTSFDIEGANQACEYDFIVVSSGDGISAVNHGRYCGNTIPAPITSNTNTMTIDFNSDDSVQQTGFQANYYIDKDECAVNKGGCQHNCINNVGSYKCTCHNGYTLHDNGLDCKEDADGCKFEIKEPNGEISSTNWPRFYPSRINCSWYFTTVLGHRVKLTFAEFAIEPSEKCSYDYVSVYDGYNMTSKQIGQYCGITIPEPVVSSGNQMYMNFRSDESVQRKGFRALHTTTCGGNLSASDTKQTIFSHTKFGDANYANNMDCEWIVEATKGRQIRLTFPVFDLEEGQDCGYDRVDIFDGDTTSSSPLGTFCGTEIPNDIDSSGRYIFIKFKSDNTVNWKGFTVTFKQV